MERFEPAPFLVVDEPDQLKAFTDPLRVRILIVLAERAATNQQLADALGEAQAKVLYHIRYLLDAGLIQLVEQRIVGGNVEKYYRAVARTFDIRLTPELRPDFLGAEFSALSQEVVASAHAWPEMAPRLVIRGRRVSPEQAASFFERLMAFINEYWDDPHNEAQVASASDDPLFYCAAVVFRSVRDAENEEHPE